MVCGPVRGAFYGVKIGGDGALHKLGVHDEIIINLLLYGVLVRGNLCPGADKHVGIAKGLCFY